MAAPAPAPIDTGWRSRIVGSGEAPPRDLIANPRNWRLHPGAQHDALASVLDRVGWVGSVLVNRTTGRLVDGHLRVELAISRDEPTVPVTYVELTEDEEALVLASLDPLAAMAATDSAKLHELMASVDLGNAELERQLVSFLAGAPKLGLADPDAVPDVPAEPYVQAGELWLLGDHRMVVGDATDPEAVARLLDGASPRLLVTDPPYGVSLDPTWRDGVYNKLGPGALPYMTEAHENRTLSGDTIVDWSPAFALVPSIEVAYVWHAGVHAAAVADGLVAMGLEIRSQIIWSKSHFAMSRGDYHWQHEPCWYAVRRGAKADWLGPHDMSTVWQAASPKMIMGGSDEEKFDHPAQKPMVCMERPIEKHVGDVYEPFLGSGTTLIAAERQGRRCYAIEIDPKYSHVAIERWQAYTGREAVRG